MPSSTDPLLAQLAERVRARAGVSTTFQPPRTVLDWAKRYRKIDGQPFSLHNFKPLQALYEDDWPNLVIQKPAQRGVSEWAICLTCFALEYGAQRWVKDGSKRGINIGLVFPAKADLTDFSKERLSDLRSETSHLAEMFDGDEFDSLGFKKVGDSYLYLRGGYSRAGLRSFPADLIILDEFDELAPGAVALAKRRLNASMVQRLVEISTPSIPGKGISAEYASSDQRVYQTQCQSCESWNSYDFFRDVHVAGEPWDEWQRWSQVQVERNTVTLNCPECGAVQDNEDRCRTGRWIALQPEVTRTHGYHIPWWPFPYISLAGLAHSAVSPDAAEINEFYHSDLGLPHGAGEGGITEEMLAQLAATLPDGLPEGPWRDTTLGCDVGSRLHYRISSIGPDGSVYVRSMGAVGDWDTLDQLMLRYQVRQAVVDAEPELHAAIAFCQRWAGRAVRSFYPTGVSALKGTLLHHKPNSFDIQVNRAVGLDSVYHVISTAQEHWPRQFATDPDIVSQMSSSVRVKQIDERTGQQTYDWSHSGPDHYMHASCYDLCARRLLPTVRNQIPAVGGSRKEFTPYAIGSSRIARETGPSRWQVIR